MYIDGRLKIFSGTANPELAEAIASHLGMSLGNIEVGRFSNGEIRVIINESVRGSDVFLIQPTCHPVNDTLMELLIITDALKRASAQCITAVVPFFGYARQDRKTRGREPISAKLVANLITVAGANRLVTVDFHAGQLQGFFDIPVDHLSAIPIVAEYFKNKAFENTVVVSPDPGGVARARELAGRLHAGIAFIDKRRPAPNVSEVMNVVGQVEGCTAIIIDDIIDTAGTIVQSAHALLERGAKSVYACCTHPVLSGPALQRLEEAPLTEVVVTDTIPVNGKGCSKLKQLSISSLLADTIIRIHEDLSVSQLFK